MTAPDRPLRWYRDQGPRARLHVAARWATAPFGPLDDLLPASGRILDWGCGHGLLSVWAAARAPGRTVEGVDLDAAKLDHATRAAEAAGVADRVTFRQVAADDRPIGRWDAIVIDDVLYLLAPADQESLVAAAAGALAPGGVLVVKEMDHQPAWKHALTRAQEVVAVRVLRVTATSGPLHPAPTASTVAGWMRAAGLEARCQRLDRGYHVPHAAAIGRRASGAAPGGTLPS